MRAILFVTLAVAYAAAAVAQAVAPTAPAGPSITTTAALNHAVIVSISGGTPGATLYYTTDGATPTAQSTRYLAPFLVASDLTVKAAAIADGNPGTVSTEKFSPAIPPGTLVWSDEFNDAADLGARPNPADLDLRHRPLRLRQSRVRALLCLGRRLRSVRSRAPKCLRRLRRLPPHRRPPAHARRLHLRAPQERRPLQRRLWNQQPPHRSPHEASRRAGNLARLLDPRQQHRHRQVARMRRAGHHGAHQCTHARLDRRLAPRHQRRHHGALHRLAPARILRRRLAHLRHHLDQRQNQLLRRLALQRLRHQHTRRLLHVPAPSGPSTTETASISCSIWRSAATGPKPPMPPQNSPQKCSSITSASTPIDEE